ncbi:MAG: hypothetical protein M5T61_11665 [Acidimicrobiia bacterium]|nr:hypothetical protein [Acidimicrobiia bacterium]
MRATVEPSMREMVAAKAGGGDVVEVGTVVDVSAVVVGRCGELVQGPRQTGRRRPRRLRAAPT